VAAEVEILTMPHLLSLIILDGYQEQLPQVLLAQLLLIGVL